MKHSKHRLCKTVCIALLLIPIRITEAQDAGVRKAASAVLALRAQLTPLTPPSGVRAGRN
jgi:hypothetical protein